jgi:hypothetical protein
MAAIPSCSVGGSIALKLGQTNSHSLIEALHVIAFSFLVRKNMGLKRMFCLASKIQKEDIATSPRPNYTD